MRVLGIETSCDDTGVAVYDDERGLLAHKLASQVETHQPYGGVVPELAARDHIRLLMPLVGAVLDEAGGRYADAVAYTAGPGLAGALLGGAAAWLLAGKSRLLVSTTWKGISLRRCLKKTNLTFPFWRCSFQADTRSWSMCTGSAAISCSEQPGMMRSAKPLTRPRSYWGSVTPGVLQLRPLPSTVRRSAIVSHDR